MLVCDVIGDNNTSPNLLWLDAEGGITLNPENIAPVDLDPNTVRHSLYRYDIRFLLPPGEGQDEGEKKR